jgi:hypothetical protein
LSLRPALRLPDAATCLWHHRVLSGFALVARMRSMPRVQNRTDADGESGQNSFAPSACRPRASMLLIIGVLVLVTTLVSILRVLRAKDAANLQRVREMEDDEGFNAQTERYENLVQSGVIDPTKVVRSGIQNAASIASILLTTEAVSQIPEQQNGL